jgi:DNA segregation ATPase FtsK/SpoIIIE-like protein
MPEHFPKETVEASAWCSKCGKGTMHRVDNGLLGPCLACIATLEANVLYQDAVKSVQTHGYASVITLADDLKVNHGVAVKLIDQLEEMGVVGPATSAARRPMIVRPVPPVQEEFFK